ncbi:MAG: ABC transporter permease [Rhodospirillaceae bacterium]|nr:ABC transporter permease [Rhodospirillaceae bacterium]
MTALLLRRLIDMVVVLVAMSFIVYALIGLMPGDPIDEMMAADPTLSAADAQRLKALYGLDRPLVERYLAWAGEALHGRLGYSRLYARPVLDVMGPRLANTVLLMGASFTLALLLAVPAGLLAAVRPHGTIDSGINLAAFAGMSVPPFWLAILLILLFSVTLRLLPAGGTGALEGGFLVRAQHLVLPVLSLTLASTGRLVRYVRAAMMEALRQDYIRTARAKGAGTLRVVVGHALRNAMVPVVTVVALDFGVLFSGALVTEAVFAYPGMGKTIYDAILGNDYNLALVGLMLATAVVLACNLLADLAYLWLDPRIGQH